MSKKFELVKRYYQRGLWTETMVRNAVGRWITEEERNIILGIVEEAAVGDSEAVETEGEEQTAEGEETQEAGAEALTEGE